MNAQRLAIEKETPKKNPPNNFPGEKISLNQKNQPEVVTHLQKLVRP